MEAGKYKIRAQISIRKADIKIDGVNCDFHLIAEPYSESWNGQERQTKNTQSAFEANAETSLSSRLAGSAVDVKANAGHQHSRARSQDLTKQNRSWHQKSNTLISIENPNPKDFLDGRIIDDVDVGIRVTPSDRAQRVGVLARVRVREDWIELKNIDGNFPKSFWKSILGKTKVEKNRRAMFGHLLAHLVANELQDEKESRDATLCAAALVFRPVELDVHGQALPRGHSNISIDPVAVEDFIKTPIGEEVQFLQDLGVFEDDQADILQKQKEFVRLWGARKQVWPWKVVRIPSKTLALLFEGSFGRKYIALQVGQRVLNVKFSDQPAKHLEIDAIRAIVGKEIEGRLWFDDIALYFGFCFKGHNAYRIAKLFGFSLSYQTFIKRVKDQSHEAGVGVGYIIPLHAILNLDEVDENAWDILDGLELTIDLK